MERISEIPWRNWVQANFTALVLLGIVLLSLTATVALMHEAKIDDKYVTWLEGFTEAGLTSLALSLRGAGTTAATTTTKKDETTNDPGSGTDA